jgi:drug/metabolite transporter (DMT)-like permease
VVNSILGIIVFGERMQPLTVAGALLVLVACAYVALRERIMGLFG